MIWDYLRKRDCTVKEIKEGFSEKKTKTNYIYGGIKTHIFAKYTES